MAQKKAVRLRPASWEYANYAAFKNAALDQTAVAGIIQRAMPTGASLADQIGHGSPVPQLTGSSVEGQLRSVFNDLNKQLNNKNISPEQTPALDGNSYYYAGLADELLKLIQEVQSLGYVTHKSTSKMQTILSALGEGYHGAAPEAWWLRVNLATALGDMYEVLLADILNEKGPVAQDIVTAAIAESLPPDAKMDNIRFNGSSTNKIGTRLVDITAKGTKEGVTYTISAKLTPGQKTKTLKVLTTTLGNLLNNLGRMDEKQSFGWFRLFGYTSNVSPELRNYLVLHNIKDVMVGSDGDEITDMIINDKVYSVRSVLNSIASNFTQTRIFETTGFNAPAIPFNSTYDPIYNKAGLTTPEDKAIRTWVEEKNLSGITGRKITIELNPGAAGIKL